MLHTCARLVAVPGEGSREGNQRALQKAHPAMAEFFRGLGHQLQLSADGSQRLTFSDDVEGVAVIARFVTMGDTAEAAQFRTFFGLRGVEDEAALTTLLRHLALTAAETEAGPIKFNILCPFCCPTSV